jgi:hypothetical protein
MFVICNNSYCIIFHSPHATNFCVIMIFSMMRHLSIFFHIDSYNCAIIAGFSTKLGQYILRAYIIQHNSHPKQESYFIFFQLELPRILFYSNYSFSADNNSLFLSSYFNRDNMCVMRVICASFLLTAFTINQGDWSKFVLSNISLRACE